MTKLPTDDDRLVNFLKANRPNVPPAASDLEERILQAVELETPSRESHFFSHHPAKCKRLWLFPPAIAVGMMFAIASDSFRTSSIWGTTLATTNPNDAELVSLEEFLENSWHDVVNHHQPSQQFTTRETDWLLSTNFPSQTFNRSIDKKTARK